MKKEKMLSNRGFTVVELVVSFALAMTVAYFIFDLLYSLKNLATDAGVKTELLQKQALMVKEVEKDLENKKLVLATNCGKYCLDFLFDDQTTKRLSLNTTSNLFQYGNFVIKLIDGSDFGTINVVNERVLTTPGGVQNDSWIKIKIPIKNKIVEGDYGLNLVYQYNSNEVSFNDLIFDNAASNILYLKGSQDMVIFTDNPYQEPGYFWIDNSGTQRTDSVSVSGSVGASVGTYTLTYKVTYNSKTFTRTRKVTVKDKTYDYEFVKSAQVFQAPYKGTYKIELWGAGTGEANYGKGGYTRGNITLNKNEKLYIYTGEQGKLATHGNNTSQTFGKGGAATFNGGGAGGEARGSTTYPYANYYGGNSGGGATDVRLTKGNWNDTTSLRSRIMVAGGAGGCFGANDKSIDTNVSQGGTTTGGAGGITLAQDQAGFVSKRGTGGTQTSGNAFGIGGAGARSGIDNACNGHSGGGGGYYGGKGGQSTGGSCYQICGGGGSSFISGYSGCNAVNSDGTHRGNATHYSGKVFTSATMISGTGSMPNPRLSSENSVGNSGNGYARITLVSIQN